MLRQIISVIGARYTVAVLNLALILVNARTLGPEGLGVVALLWASMNINVTVNSLLSGNTIVYFMNRYPAGILYPIALLWTVAGSAAGTATMAVAGIIPDGYAAHAYALSLLYSIPMSHSRMLLAGNDLRGFNMTNIIQGGGLFPIVIFVYFCMGRADVGGYLAALYMTYAAALVFSLARVLKRIRLAASGEGATAFTVRHIIRDMFVYGLWGCVDNVAEMLATRVNYFFVEQHLGRGAVGILDAATRIAESVWHTSRSIAHIQYNRIAQTTDPRAQREVTRKAAGYAMAALVAMVAVLVAIPEDVYTSWLFTADFKGLRHIIMILAPGIVALGLNTVLSHHFIGSGGIRYAAASSLTGLGVILVAGYLLIPTMGLTGSAISSVAAFVCMTGVSAFLYFFRRLY
ncbi:MAG: polysaccharide biosynthesis C-terminal domain-containing protein [Tannerellaceae bacterium]|jgi:O-antigen/teichoic acid export membrane protein|nr:polysaccharide biosynthesis C-terminal domain-containing protein [Tannerellaceae bacterium]